MKTIKDKQLLMAADIAGYYLKEAIKEHLEGKGWTITDIGVTDPDDPNPEMFHRIGLKVGAKIAEREFERAMIFCGTGMGIHIAASKCPHVHSAVCESVHSAKRAITGNNVNVLALGGHWIGHNMGIEIADIFVENELGSGYEWWPNFYEFHKLAYDELNEFDYETFKKNGFEFPDAIDIPLDACDKPEELKSK